MNVEQFVVGSLGTNCYIVGNEQKALVIDPGDDFEVIRQHLRNRELEYILLTHTHIDHIGALTQMKQAYPEAKVAVHSKEVSFLKNPEKNLSAFIGNPFTYQGPVEITLEDGMELPFLGSMIQVFHTPGHTPGGCCFLIENYLFSGDTLFRMSIGRTDFPGGSYPQLINNILEKLFRLPDSTRVFSGHMEETTIGYEKKNNPFLN